MAKSVKDKLFEDLDNLLDIDKDLFAGKNKSDEKKKKQKFFNKLKREMAKLGDKSDKDYSKVMLRKMAEKGVMVIEMLEEEMKKDVYARDAEVCGQLINHVVNIIDKINHINREEKKVELAEKKLQLEERKISRGLLPGQSAEAGIVNNIIAVGNTAELVDLIREKGDQIPEVPTVEAEYEIEGEKEDVNSRK